MKNSLLFRILVVTAIYQAYQDAKEIPVPDTSATDVKEYKDSVPVKITVSGLNDFSAVRKLQTFKL